MKKVENELDIISEITGIKDKTIIDVGCGAGELVRKLTAEGAGVIGIDRPDMLVKAKNNQKLLQGGLKNEGGKGRRVEGEKVRSSKMRLKASKPCVSANSHELSSNRHPNAFSADTVHLKKPSVGPKGLIGPPCHGAPGRRRQAIFTAGLGENLPFKNNYADIIIFFASFHHVPGAMMRQTLQETHRVLKAGGIGIFLEPIGRKGSYFEILRLMEDERDIQQLAFESIKKAHTFGLENKREEITYFERSFDDYINLLNVFVDDAAERNGYLKEARKITEILSQEAGIPFEDYRYKSICRVNVLQKS